MTSPRRIVTSESIWRETDSESGSRLLQLTGSPAVHSNIYCEVPYTDPTSRYVFYQRNHNTYGPWELWRADLRTLELTLAATDTAETLDIAISFDQRFFYCVRVLPQDGGPAIGWLKPAPMTLEILRIDTTTLEEHSVVFDGLSSSLSSLGGISPDYHLYYTSLQLGPHRFGIARFDLERGVFDVIHEGADDLCNAHTQLEPGQGRDLLIQHNRGAEIDDEGNLLKLVGDEGATMYLIDTDGGNLRRLPVGKPYTHPCQGHQSWLSDTGEILLTTGWDTADQARAEGCLLKLRPGDEEALVVARGHLYCHPNASKDGRFFVSDTFDGAKIVVGSIATGKTRVLCASGSSFGGPQYTHPHPYFTPDRRWVIFNSDRVGIPHVYAATVPEGLLESLDEK